MLQQLSHLSWDIFKQPLFLIGLAFQIWMLVDAVRRQEYVWAVFIFLFSFISAFFYFFMVYRPSGGLSSTSGFELPGSHDRRRIKELESKIHHLDKPHHYLQLGDIYFQQGKLDKAEECYRNSIARDADDPDSLAHLGQCLLRKKAPAEAKPLLEKVVQLNLKHDYGHTLMAYAECLAALGETGAAVEQLKKVLEHFSYARARVQLGALYLEKGEKSKAAQELKMAIHEDRHAPNFQKKKERVWIRKARKLLKQA